MARLKFNELSNTEMNELDYDKLKEREQCYIDELQEGEYISMREEQIDLLACQVRPLDDIKKWIQTHPDASALEIALEIDDKLNELSALISKYTNEIKSKRSVIGGFLADVQGRLAVLDALKAGQIAIIEE